MILHAWTNVNKEFKKAKQEYLLYSVHGDKFQAFMSEKNTEGNFVSRRILMLIPADWNWRMMYPI